MLRTTEHSENDQIVRLRLDGTISSDSLPDLEAILAAHQQSDGHEIILDMAGVSFMHDSAAEKLAQLRGDSLQIINCSPFIATLLATATRMDGNSRRPKTTTV
jgi:anti-anti-sigma regulatory factor